VDTLQASVRIVLVEAMSSFCFQARFTLKIIYVAVCTVDLKKSAKKMSLSEGSKDYLKKIENKIEEVYKPTWTEYFMSMALLASSRSIDAETKHGCVITDTHNRILGVGYNSFPVGMPDSILPNKRPEKYKWMVHAERNALSNCTLRPEGGTAYITGKPCLECVKAMYQEGIRKLVCLDAHGTHLLDDEDEYIFEILCKEGDLKVEWIKKCQN